MSNEKMAKSQGNILKINDFRGKINGQVLRLALMSTHYKQPLDWNDELINYCQNTLNKWYESYIELTKQVMIPEKFLNPLYDDLNTPGYIANLHKLFEKSQKGDLKDKEIFTSACHFIGLLSDTKKKWVEFKKSKSEISEKEILSKVKERNEARDNKNYKLADKIRNELLDKGVSIEDKDGKTTWKFK
jgi:cysteinyl-tRNA synthetase